MENINGRSQIPKKYKKKEIDAVTAMLRKNQVSNESSSSQASGSEGSFFEETLANSRNQPRKSSKKSNINAINALESSRKNLKELFLRTTENDLNHSEIIGLRMQVKTLKAREAKERKSNFHLRDELQFAKGRLEELKPFNNLVNSLSSQTILKNQKNLELNNSNSLPAENTPNNEETFQINPEEFKCKRCDTKFNNAEYLVEHLEREHVLPAKTPNPVEFKCPRCDKKYNKPEDLVEHLESEHANPAKTQNPEEFKCQRCDKKYNKPEDLVEHLDRVHVVYKNGNFECVICGKKFRKEIDFSKHSKDSHENNKNCEMCGKEFRNGRDLESHMKKYHGKWDLDKQLPNESFEGFSARYCKLCRKGCKNASKKDAHDRKMHPYSQEYYKPYYQREYRRDRFQPYRRDYRDVERYERQDYRDYGQSRPQIIIKGGINSFGKIGNSYNQYRKHSKRY